MKVEHGSIKIDFPDSHYIKASNNLDIRVKVSDQYLMFTGRFYAQTISRICDMHSNYHIEAPFIKLDINFENDMMVLTLKNNIKTNNDSTYKWSSKTVKITKTDQNLILKCTAYYLKVASFAKTPDWVCSMYRDIGKIPYMNNEIAKNAFLKSEGLKSFKFEIFVLLL